MAAAPAYSGSGVVSMMADVAQSETGTSEASGTSGATGSDDAAGDAVKPAGESAASTAATQATTQGQASAVQPGAAADQPAQGSTEPAAPDGEAKLAAAEPDAAANAEPKTQQTAAGATEPAAAETQAAQQVAAAEEPRKKGFLAYFFSPQPAKPAPTPIVNEAASQTAEENPSASQEKATVDEAAAKRKPLIDPGEKAKPLVKLASVDPEEASVQKAAAIVPMDALPGVRTSSLFEIRRVDGLDDDSDIDLNEAEGGIYHVASAAGLARLAPNGLLKARETVDTACLKPALVRMLKAVEQRFGKKLILTSGYRSREYNRKVRGARNSMHMYCAAADVVMPGVSKWEIAQFVRSMPGRGGVGTYCHTDAVHIDVGPERDWNWRCRRRG